MQGKWRGKGVSKFPPLLVSCLVIEPSQPLGIMSGLAPNRVFFRDDEVFT